MNTHRPLVDDFNGAPAATHDMACAVMWGRPGTPHAVLSLNTGIFHPCWEAQADGYRLVRVRNWWQRLCLWLAACEVK